jgi:hypothetical protein
MVQKKPELHPKLVIKFRNKKMNACVGFYFGWKIRKFKIRFGRKIWKF